MEMRTVVINDVHGVVAELVEHINITLMMCGHTALFRSSWASLAKMEVDKIGP